MRTLIATVLLFAAAALAASAPRPREIVATTADDLVATLVARRAEFQADAGKLTAYVRETLESHFDAEYSARLVLGRHGRGVPDTQVREFADALIANLMHRYGSALLDFDPDITVAVKGEAELRDGALVRVATEVQRRGAAPVTIDYLFRPGADGAWKVFDVIVEGVSYVQTYRTQFDEHLRAHSLADTIADLRANRLAVGDDRR